MTGRLHALIATCLVAGCTGLTLTRDVGSPARAGVRSPCGVLLCVESLDSAMTTPGVDQTNTTDAFNTIFSMAFYRSSWSTFSKSNHGNLVAALTLQRPSITQESNGIKVSGFLTDREATLRLELMKKKDCRADYMCKVTAVSPDGREIERTVQLVQPPDQRELPAEGNSLTSAVALVQLLTLVQGMDSKLAVVSRKAEEWERRLSDVEETLREKVEFLERSVGDKIEYLEKSVADKIEYLERSIDEKMACSHDRMEDKIGIVENNVREMVETLQTRMQDGIDSIKTGIEDKMENRIVDKLCQLDLKMFDITNSPCLSGDVRKPLEDSLVTLRKEMERGQGEILAHLLTVHDYVGDNFNKTFEIYQKLNDSLQNHFAPLLENNQPVAAETTQFEPDFLSQKAPKQPSGGWPSRPFGLLKPITGCPAWPGLSVGYYKIHTESSSGPGNGNSHTGALPSSTISVEDSQNTMTLQFCEAACVDSGIDWPQGSYCINALNQRCPVGFEESWIFLDTEDDNSSYDDHNTSVVSDRFNYNERFIDFCCMTTGSPSVPIVLPTERPFLLYRRGGQCQLVQGMDVYQESITIDTEDYFNKDYPHPDFPFDFDENDEDPRTFHLCYYV